MKARKELGRCLTFLELQRGWRTYAKQYPERVKAAERLFEQAEKALAQSAHAFFGGKVEVVVKL